MKARDKARELDAFVQRLRAAFNTLDGRESEKLLKSLDRKITQTVGLKELLAKTKTEPLTQEEVLLVSVGTGGQAL